MKILTPEQRSKRTESIVKVVGVEDYGFCEKCEREAKAMTKPPEPTSAAKEAAYNYTYLFKPKELDQAFQDFANQALAERELAYCTAVKIRDGEILELKQQLKERDEEISNLSKSRLLASVLRLESDNAKLTEELLLWQRRTELADKQCSDSSDQIIALTEELRPCGERSASLTISAKWQICEQLITNATSSKS